MQDFEATFERILEAHRRKAKRPVSNQEPWKGWKTTVEIAAHWHVPTNIAFGRVYGDKRYESRKTKSGNRNNRIREWRILVFNS